MQEEKIQDEHVDSRDWLLQDLARLSNELGFEFPVTLFAGGLMISGFTVSGARYFDWLGAQIEEGVKPSVSATLAAKIGKSFKERGEPYRERQEEIAEQIRAAEAGEEIAENKSEEDPIENVSYIHLRNVRILGLAGTAPVVYPASAIWRGHIGHIDGFVYGIPNVD